MSSTSYEVSFTAEYNGTEFTRQYALTSVSSVAAATEVVRGKVNAINASLSGGTATDIANLFVSDDYDSTENIGTLKSITNVKIKATEETYISKPLSAMRLEAANTDDGNNDRDDQR